MTGPKGDESFVLWIDREPAQPGQLTGRVEQMRKSLRVAFGSTSELVRFLERGILEPRAPAANELGEEERGGS